MQWTEGRSFQSNYGEGSRAEIAMWKSTSEQLFLEVQRHLVGSTWSLWRVCPSIWEHSLWKSEKGIASHGVVSFVLDLRHPTKDAAVVELWEIWERAAQALCEGLSDRILCFQNWAIVLGHHLELPKKICGHDNRKEQLGRAGVHPWKGVELLVESADKVSSWERNWQIAKHLLENFPR